MRYTFLDLTLDTDYKVLRQGKQIYALRPKVFQVLCYLIQHRHRVVSRDDLVSHAWPETFVSDQAVKTVIREVRRVAGDNGRAPRVIETLRGHGYRFIASVEEDAHPIPEAPEEEFEREHEMSIALRSVSAQQRQLTLLGCDLAVTALQSSLLEPERLYKVLHLIQEECRETISRWGGYWTPPRSASLLVYFGYPLAQEDAAIRAVYAGLELLEKLRACQPTLDAQYGVRLSTNVGVHTGPVIIDMEIDNNDRIPLAVGEAVTVAVRLAMLGPPQTVIISAATERLVVGSFVCQGLGAYEVAGMPSPLHVYRVQHARAPFNRLVSVEPPATPLVGRTAEMALLRQRWSQAREGEGQVVLVSGEPGIGKSRLVRDFRLEVERDGGVSLVMRGSPYHAQSVLYPIVSYLHRLLQWQSEDSLEAKRAKIKLAFGTAAIQMPENFALLDDLLTAPSVDLPPGSPRTSLQKKQLQAILVALLVAASTTHPILLIGEDMQWVDPSTLELIDQLILEAPRVCVMVVLTFRPTFRPPWAASHQLLHLVLARLSSPQLKELITSILGLQPLPPTVVDQMVARADGIPLFAEECAKMLLEEGVPEMGRSDAVQDPSAQWAIPSTLQDALLARLERLTPGFEVAQVAAVCGRESPVGLLPSVEGLDAEWVQQGLDQLVAADLMVLRGQPPHVRYRFRHALIQETAYQSLMTLARQRIHHQIAQVLTEGFPEIAASQPELVARHYTEAGLTPDAVAYWRQAAQRALDGAATLEAIEHLRLGLDLLSILPESLEVLKQELDMQLMLTSALMATQGWAHPDVDRALTRVQGLCEQLGNTPRLFSALWGLWNFSVGCAALQTAHDLSHKLFNMAQSSDDAGRLQQAHQAMGATLFYKGEFHEARVQLEQSVALSASELQLTKSRQDAQERRGIVCHGLMSALLWHMGYPDQALDRLHDTLSRAQALSHSTSIAVTLNFAMFLYLSLRDVDRVYTQATAFIELAHEHGFTHWIATATIAQGWALTMQGDHQAGITQMQKGIQLWQDMNFMIHKPYALTLVAERYRAIGQTERERESLSEARLLMAKTGERHWQAELIRLEGECLLTDQGMGDKAQQAEAHFQQALDVARGQGSQSLELRAAISLSRLWWDQDEGEKARHLLSPVYYGFTEGFETADLQEAKALLNELD